MSAFGKFVKEFMRYGLEYFKLYYSFYDAVVTDNNDPRKLGRVKFRCEELNISPDFFAYPKGIWNNNSGAGVFAPPPVGSHIFVSFKYGNIQNPYYEMAYPHVGKSPTIGAVDYTNRFGFVTPEGIQVLFDDTQKSLLLKLPEGVALHVTPKGISLGSENVSAEPVVLGTKNIQALTQIQTSLASLITALSTYTTAQSGVAAGTQILAPLAAALNVLKASLETINTNVSQIPSAISATASKQNTTN